MNAVVGVTDILLDTAGLSDEQTGYIEVIRTSGQHLLTVSISLDIAQNIQQRHGWTIPQDLGLITIEFSSSPLVSFSLASPLLTCPLEHGTNKYYHFASRFFY